MTKEEKSELVFLLGLYQSEIKGISPEWKAAKEIITKIDQENCKSL